jgi:predicted transcriptional regulator
MEEQPELIDMTAEIVAAYVSTNSIPANELAPLIHSVHKALSAAANGSTAPEPVPQEPAAPIKRSVTPDYIICLEDGRRFKSLKRHLRTRYNLTPEEYRAKWGLPKDYPMVAPNYARARSELAKQMGLGQGGRKR